MGSIRLSQIQCSWHIIICVRCQRWKTEVLKHDVMSEKIPLGVYRNLKSRLYIYPFLSLLKHHLSCLYIWQVELKQMICNTLHFLTCTHSQEFYFLQHCAQAALMWHCRRHVFFTTNLLFASYFSINCSCSGFILLPVWREPQPHSRVHCLIAFSTSGYSNVRVRLLSLLEMFSQLFHVFWS